MKFIFAALLLSISACSTLPNSHTVETEHGHFSYYLSGEHKPTVILESGLGDDMTTWRNVISRIEPAIEVFTYNRAGFSGSQSKNQKRNGEVIAKELKAILTTLNLAPPYVLVGHSLGGGYMELYAKMFPDEVSGIVFVDPNSSKYPERCKAQGLNFCDPPSDIPSWASLFLPNAIEGEIKDFATTHAQINALSEFPNVPLVVLSATKSRATNSQKEIKANKLYTQLHKELAKLSSNAKFVSCDDCSHYIQNDKPSLVVESIQWVLNQQ